MTPQIHELKLPRAEANLCEVQRKLPADCVPIATRYTRKHVVTLYTIPAAPVAQPIKKTA